MAKKKLIIVMGKTSCGKDTVCKCLKEKYGSSMVISFTTRPKRSYETDGKEHYFVSEKRMDELEKQDDMLAYTKFPKTGYRYCSTVSSMSADVMTYILNPDGVDYMEANKDNLDIEYHVLYLYLPEDVIRERAEARGDDKDLIEKRMSSEAEQFDQFYSEHRYDYCIDMRQSREAVKQEMDNFMSIYFPECKKVI